MARQRLPKWLRVARASGQQPGDWIGRALPRAGVMPPEAVAEAIQAGRLRINGEPVRDQLAPVSAVDRVELDGRLLDLRAPTLVLMFHKPAGVIVARHDAEGGGTVFDALQLPEELKVFGWHAVGRLDRMTTGLLLFTNDERIVHHVTSPETHLPKRYVAQVGSVVRDEQLQALTTGVAIDDGMAKALSAQRRAPRELELVIAEGRYHQVRRMLNAVRLPVDALQRESIGDLVLDVPMGEWRRLSAEEIHRGLRFDLPLRDSPVAE